jgi:ribosomal protein S18 acetylase RimI-like enzyme
MRNEDLDQAVSLQKLAFPPPFSEDLHWDQEHLEGHIALFPEGQFVAESEGKIVGTCSNTIISEERWLARENWYRTVGGPKLNGFLPTGSTLYGIDITVHPDYRRLGVGRQFYRTRYELVEMRGLLRYGTGCRLPDFRAQGAGLTLEQYANRVVLGEITDRTLTPLLSYGLRFLGIIRNYMPDYESDDAAALLEHPRQEFKP